MNRFNREKLILAALWLMATIKEISSCVLACDHGEAFEISSVWFGCCILEFVLFCFNLERDTLREFIIVELIFADSMS